MKTGGVCKCRLMFLLSCRRSLCLTGGRGCCGGIRDIERHAGQKRSGNKIPDGDGEQVPEKPLAHGDGRAKHHAGRDQEHVDNGVLEAEREESHDRKPHGGDLADGRTRDQGQHRPDRHHPVAEKALHQRGGPATWAQCHVRQGLFLRSYFHEIGNRAAISGAPIGDRQIKKRRVEHAADHVPAYTQAQLRSNLVTPTVPAITPAGSKAKFPVTNSSPSNASITNPTGKRIAPAIGGRPCDDTMKTRDVAYPRNAPARIPRMSMSRTGRSDFLLANCTASCNSSLGLT